MSPASAGALQVEQYIGACLISQNRPKNNKPRGEFYPPNNHNNVYHHQSNPYGNYQHDGWAGGVPLISFANHQRRGGGTNRSHEETNSNLSRLAVHTQGAPLIVTKSYQHRKNKPQRTTEGVQQTKIFENSNHKKHPHQNSGNQCLREVIENSNKNVDAISVTSDESSGSQNSVEMCLPRIIKPRKRRKKDRKPPHLRTQTNDFEYNNNAPLESPTPQKFSSYHNVPNNYINSNLIENRFELNTSSKHVPEAINPIIFETSNEISETPKLHHNFEDVKEDLNGNQPSVSCQCTYCDRSGQNIWDIDRSCYSPFLTPPKVFDFGNLESVLSSISSSLEGRCLSEFSPKENPPKRRSSSFSRSWSSSSGSSDLEVSTEIVTSLNGHRDLEIKFFNPSSVNNASVGTDKKVNDNFLSSFVGAKVDREMFGGNHFFSSSVNNSSDQDGLCEQNTSFFSNGTIAF